MNSKKLTIGGIFLLVFSVWAFKQICADQMDNELVMRASLDWNDGNEIYDINRCGLPLIAEEENGQEPQQNSTEMRAKRHLGLKGRNNASDNAKESDGGEYKMNGIHRHNRRSKRYIPRAQRGDIAHKNGTNKILGERKVMGGKPVESGDFPWAVAIYIGQTYICSGTLISKKHVLTAAHCFAHSGSRIQFTAVGGCSGLDDAWDSETILKYYKIYIGSICLHDRHDLDNDCQSKRKQQEFGLKKIIYKQFFEGKCAGSGWNFWNIIWIFTDDFAIIELDKEVPAEIANHICMVHLDERIMAEDFHSNAKPVVAFGWGWDPLEHLESSVDGMSRLQRLEMPNIWSSESCEKQFSDVYHQDMLCTMEKADTNVCKGDSGGGLIAQFEDFNGQKRWYLLGAVSFGADCVKLIQGRDKPEGQVYTNVTSHRADIDKFLGTEDHSKFKSGKIPPMAKPADGQENQSTPEDEGSGEYANFGCDY